MRKTPVITKGETALMVGGILIAVLAALHVDGGGRLLHGGVVGLIGLATAAFVAQRALLRPY